MTYMLFPSGELIFKIAFTALGLSSSAGKESICNAGNPGLIPGSGRSSGEGIRYQLQYSSASLVAQTVKNSPAMWKIWVSCIADRFFTS